MEDKALYEIKRGVSEGFEQWLGFFVQWHINLCGLFNDKAILVEEQYSYYLTQ